MSDIKLFRLSESTVQEISGSSFAIEKPLQRLIEQHLETFLGVRFLASEFSTTKSHGGRIDTLGIDDTDCPVIVEYKRALNENVINQGLFYLNWLMEHRAEFKLLVMEKLGTAEASRIEWRYPRLICIAAEFTKFDIHAIAQIPQNIDLVRYRCYGDDLVLLELVGHQSTLPTTSERPQRALERRSTRNGEEEIGDLLVPSGYALCSSEVHGWYEQIRAFTLALGDDVEERTLPAYVAFRRLKSFAIVKFQHSKHRIVIEVPLPTRLVELEPGFLERQPRNYVRIIVDGPEDLRRAEPIIALAYEKS